VIADFLRGQLVVGPVDPPDLTQDAVRQRALNLVALLLDSAKSAIRQIEDANSGRPANDWPTPDRERIRTMAQLVDTMAWQVYFASGAYRPQGQVEGKPPLTRDQRKRFYKEAGTILGLLEGIGLPSIAHHLLETLESLVEFDPEGVFLRIGRVLEAGAKYGYQYESQAAGLLVKLIEQYLADHRDIFQTNAACRQTLREALDLFIGWPAARRLAYRLDDIFR